MAAAIVYVAHADDGDIGVLRLDDHGTPTRLATVPVPTLDGRAVGAGASIPLAVDPDARFLFAALRSEPWSVASFAIARPSGDLRLIGVAQLEASMAYLTTDRRGRFLLAASYEQSEITVSPIAPGGIVAATQQRFATLPHAHSVVVLPSNERVLATSLGGDAVHQLRIDPTAGTLELDEPAVVRLARGSGPRHLALARDGTTVYVLGELDGCVSVHRVDPATGTLGPPVQRASALPDAFAGTPWAADVHLTPDGRFLYASERTSSTLAGFRVHTADGTLARIGSVATAPQPRAFAIDPSGRFVVVAGERSNTLRVHAIDRRDGSLAPRSEIPVGRRPTWVEIVRLPADGDAVPR